MEFNPSIKERETIELIIIAHGDTDHWQQEAIDQAKSELKRRNISKEYESTILKEIEQEKQLDKQEVEEQRRLNATESYTIANQILIIVLSIWILIGKRRYDMSLSELKADNYILKYGQRRRTLIFGTFIYILTIYILTEFNV